MAKDRLYLTISNILTSGTDSIFIRFEKLINKFRLYSVRLIVQNGQDPKFSLYSKQSV